VVEEEKPMTREISLVTPVLLVAALAAGCDSEAETPPPGEASVGGEATVAEPTADAEAEPVAEPEPEARVLKLAPVAVSVVDYVGVTVSDRATVSEVISDRGFYLGAGENRVLAVVREDVPQREMIDIDAGARIRFEGVVSSPSAVDDVTGSLEPTTRDAIANEPAFLALHWTDIELL
jgi:hypothetical protein